jgi:3-oxoacyl-[acyl-carrier-protein] synthase II
MKARIAGVGWVTPLGASIEQVWGRLNNGDQAELEAVTDAAAPFSYNAFKVSPSILSGLPPHPRLRRASAISRFSAAAGLAAIKEAQVLGLTIDPSRTALVFAISNGGVIYTRRFYHDIVSAGASGASPILFPETVFNAPASHLAALLGISGQTYTLVGDGSVGLSAINMGEELLTNERLDAVLVVGAEEIDWLLCDAYARWRLLRKSSPTTDSAPGMILSEGAGALLLSRSGDIRIERSQASLHYEHRRDLKRCVETLIDRLQASKEDVVVGSANGTFVDRAEESAVRERLSNASLYSPKKALGESVGASGLWQTIVAIMALRTSKVPGVSDGDRPAEATGAVVISCGLNQGVSALRLAI